MAYAGLSITLWALVGGGDACCGRFSFRMLQPRALCVAFNQRQRSALLLTLGSMKRHMTICAIVRSFPLRPGCFRSIALWMGAWRWTFSLVVSLHGRHVEYHGETSRAKLVKVPTLCETQQSCSDMAAPCCCLPSARFPYNAAVILFLVVVDRWIHCTRNAASCCRCKVSRGVCQDGCSSDL